MKTSARKRAVSKKSRNAGKGKAAARKSRKRVTLRKAAQVAFRKGGED